jgi:hypothetical protein
MVFIKTSPISIVLEDIRDTRAMTFINFIKDFGKDEEVEIEKRNDFF